jgi:hypothetical protein
MMKTGVFERVENLKPGFFSNPADGAAKIELKHLFYGSASQPA